MRWFLRRRMERLVERLNTKLERPIEPFKLMRRQDMIVRLTYDPVVMKAAADHAAETGVPGSVAFDTARRYAREIVPGFSALFYFGFGTRAARWLSQMFYKVKVGKIDAALADIDRDATIVFVMNHRSNMDYVLVTWLVANRGALSYAVGEWARIWPLSALIRSMGAYFIRRNARNNTLYRRVLARYVQMTTAEGTTQAVFPEGGLSLTGAVGAARMGLLSYMVSGYDPAGRDVVFVPVALAYDRVLEDRVLVEAGRTGVRQFRARPLAILAFIGRMVWRVLRRRFPGFGAAAAGFGAPVSLRSFLAEHGGETDKLGEVLMAAVVRSLPVLPVPLVAAVLSAGPVLRPDLERQFAAMVTRLEQQGATLRLPEGAGVALAEGLKTLEARNIVRDGPRGLEPTPDKADLFAFYAAPVLQFLEDTAEHDGTLHSLT